MDGLEVLALSAMCFYKAIHFVDPKAVIPPTVGTRAVPFFAVAFQA